MPPRASSSRNSGTQAKRRVDGEDVGAGDSRSSPRVQFAPFAVQLLCSVQSDDAAAVPFLSSVQLVHFLLLKHAAQHAAVVLHANDGASLPTLPEQHIPLVVFKIVPHEAAVPTARSDWMSIFTRSRGPGSWGDHAGAAGPRKGTDLTEIPIEWMSAT